MRKWNFKSPDLHMCEITHTYINTIHWVLFATHQKLVHYVYAAIKKNEGFHYVCENVSKHVFS